MDYGLTKPKQLCVCCCCLHYLQKCFLHCEVVSILQYVFLIVTKSLKEGFTKNKHIQYIQPHHFSSFSVLYFATESEVLLAARCRSYLVAQNTFVVGYKM